MAIHKRHRHSNNQAADAAQPSFSYPMDPRLIEVVLETWVNQQFTYIPPGPAGTPPITVNLFDAMTDRDRNGNPTKLAFNTATARIQAAGLDLKRAVVITEAEHDNDYFMDDEEVVFVLPNVSRVKAGTLPPPPGPIPTIPATGLPPANLLDVAKLLMACTPNGI